MNQTVVMFDLENTIIDNWNKKNILENKCENMKNILNSLQIDNKFKSGGIFSFAVDNKKEKDEAQRAFTSFIDIKFDLKLMSEFFPTLEDIFCIVDSHFGIKTNSLQKWEIINIFGKEICFEAFAALHPGVDFILFDDVVNNKTIIKNDGKQMIQFIRV